MLLQAWKSRQGTPCTYGTGITTGLQLHVEVVARKLRLGFGFNRLFVLVRVLVVNLWNVELIARLVHVHLVGFSR